MYSTETLNVTSDMKGDLKHMISGELSDISDPHSKFTASFACK